MKIESSGISMEDKIGDWRELKPEAIGTKLRKLYKKVQQNEFERKMTDHHWSLENLNEKCVNSQNAKHSLEILEFSVARAAAAS